MCLLMCGRVGSNDHSFILFPKHMYASDDVSFVYGRQGVKLSPTLSAFVNGVAVSTMKCIRMSLQFLVYLTLDV